MITSFKIFESNLEIEKVCRSLKIRKFQIVDGLVNVLGDVDISGRKLSGRKLTKIPVKFGRVGGYFNCSNNQLTHLEGGPRSVGGYFNCHNNQLASFRGIPEYSLNEEETFYCNGNPIYEIYKLFNTPKCIDLINEYEVIGDGAVSRVRLEEVFLELGMEVPKNLDFKNYKLI